MVFDLNTILYDQIMPVLNEVFANAMAGDVTTIALLGIGIIVSFVLIILLVELTAWLISVVKRFFLLVIVLISTGLFFFSFQDKIFVPEPDPVLMAAGIAGVLFAIVALAISVLSVKREWQKPKKDKIKDLKSEMKQLVVEEFENELEGKVKKEARPMVTATQVQSPAMLTRQALHPKNILASFHDRSILAVLSYMVVAEFGVISGVTISAPNAQVGLIFFGLFLIAAMIFIKSTYHNYITGVKHLTIALIVGVTLSIILAHVWLGNSLEMLISINYFETNALVALVTGLAVSLFMGSKE